LRVKRIKALSQLCSVKIDANKDDRRSAGNPGDYRAGTRDKWRSRFRHCHSGLPSAKLAFRR
jgi:hypothetical protein